MSGVTSGTPRVPRPGTPPKKPDRMAGDRMQTEGTGDNRGQVTRPDEQQGFFGSSDVERRRPPRFGTPENPTRQSGPTRISQEQRDRMMEMREKRIADKKFTSPQVSADPVEERKEQEEPRRDRPFGRRGRRRPPVPPRDPRRDPRRGPFFFGPRGPFGFGRGRRRPPGRGFPFGGGRSCPDPNMLILMADGSQKKAGDLVVGDLVKTYHEKDLEKAAKLARSKSLVLSSGEIENPSKVREQLENSFAKATLGDYKVKFVDIVSDVEKIKFIFDSSEIICSLTHKFFVNDSWKEAKDMVIGDEVSGKKLISTELVENGDVVHITVDDAHTYICEGLLSHNKRMRPDPDRPRPPRPDRRPPFPPRPDRERPPRPPGGFMPDPRDPGDRRDPPLGSRRPNPSKQPPDPNFEGPLPGRRPRIR